MRSLATPGVLLRRLSVMAGFTASQAAVDISSKMKPKPTASLCSAFAATSSTPIPLHHRVDGAVRTTPDILHEENRKYSGVLVRHGRRHRNYLRLVLRRGSCVM